ncbi:MAG: hypothetical protein LJE74_09530 [Proteobacteria bacterium]|nr:hypothetical protein [Pseudomonadota bacterium]
MPVSISGSVYDAETAAPDRILYGVSIDLGAFWQFVGLGWHGLKVLKL